MVSGKKSPWMSCPLQWSKDNDDDQAHVMSSSLLIDVTLLDKKKNLFYINFITEHNYF